MFKIAGNIISDLKFILDSPKVRESITWLIISQIFLLPLWISSRFNIVVLFNMAAVRPWPLILSGFVILFPILFTQIFGQLPLESLRDTLRRIVSIQVGSRTRITFGDSRRSENGAAAPPRVREITSFRRGIRDISSSDPIIEERTNPRQLLSRYVRESAAIANHIYKRSGAYLLTGVVISFLGPGVFYVRTNDIPTNIAILDHALLLLPGAGILFFIEFVALFFLRLHRAAMDEYRYFDSLRRCREETLLALMMFAENSTIVPTKEVLQSINIYSGPSKLGKDETTDILESRRLQKDEIVIIEKLVEALSVNRRERESK